MFWYKNKCRSLSEYWLPSYSYFGFWRNLCIGKNNFRKSNSNSDVKNVSFACGNNIYQTSLTLLYFGNSNNIDLELNHCDKEILIQSALANHLNKLQRVNGITISYSNPFKRYGYIEKMYYKPFMSFGINFLLTFSDGLDCVPVDINLKEC